MAIKEDDHITSGCIPSSLLGANKANCLLVPLNQYFELLLNIFIQVRRRKRRIAWA